MSAAVSSAPRVRVVCGNASRECSKDESLDVAGELLAETGLTHADLKFETIEDVSPIELAAIKASWPAVEEEPKAFSSFATGGLVYDDAAKARIEAQHAALIKGGVAVDTREQFFATGTRMAEVGYANQRARAQEHAAKLPLDTACRQLADRVVSEKREDVTVSAREFADNLHVNGKVKAFGLAVSEQAMKGLCARIESPAIKYLLGLRDRIAFERSKYETNEDGSRGRFIGDQASIVADRAKIADVIAHECRRNGDKTIKLRTRKGVGDIFAVVSPSYTPADAPEVIAQLADDLPDARGTWSYDPVSTAWELRAHVWTPTPVEEQAVGEAFEGYASFTGRDNGTGRFRGGGGVTLIRCLNASTYMAEGAEVARVHRSNVMVDVQSMLRVAMTSVDTLCAAWGTNRETSLVVPERLTINDAIPGFWRYLLTDRRSELAGVLPGRSEKHIELLTKAYEGERRDHDGSRVVRSDLAQAWTRVIQDQPTPVRRDAEQAIGDWLVSGKKVGCLVEEEG